MKKFNVKKIISKTLLVLAFIIFNSGNYFSQTWQWAKSGGGSGNDFGRVSCTDASGNVYVGGTFDSPSFTLGSVFVNNGGSDVYIAKYSTTGALLWSRTFGGTANETIGGMCTDPTGNLYITGSFNSPSVNIGTVTAITNVGSTDVYVASYNALGSVFWAIADGGAGADDAGGIAYTGTLVVCGDFNGVNATFGATTLTNAGAVGTSDVFVAKYTTAGTSLSAIRAGGTSTEMITDVVADASANIYLSGYFYGTPTFGAVSLSSQGGTDAMALKLNSANTWVWGRSGGGTTNDYGYGISVDATSNVFLTGSYTSTTFTLSAITLTNQAVAIGIENGFVAKYNSAGAVQWCNNIAGSSVVQGNDVENDAAGNAYVANRSSSFSGTTANARVLKYNSAGTIQWIANASPFGSGICSANHLSVDNNGNIFVSGQIGTNGMLANTTTLTSAGLYDEFVAKIACISPSITGVSSVCEGTSATLTITGATSGYTWSTGATTTSIVITPTASGTYSAIGSSSVCGLANSNSFSVTLLPATVNAGADLNLLCNQTQVINAVANPTSPTSVSWSPTVGLTGSTSLNPTVSAGATPQSYTVTVVLSNSCTATDVINVASYAQKPDICLVTVDTLGVNNEIFWEKTLYTSVDSFIVYREVTTNVYKRIAAISVNAYSGFTDTVRSVGPANGDPNTTSYKYKLQIRDLCGNYSALSYWHQTIFIQDQQNGNFNWNSYAIESSSTPVSVYDLFRIDLATNNYSLVTSTTAGLATDPQYSLWQTTAKWRVQANGFNCNPTNRINGTLNQKVKTKSNIKNDRLVGIKNHELLNAAISTYPSPAKDIIFIDSRALANMDMTIELQNALGQIVYSKKYAASSNEKYQIETTGFANGIYFVNIKQENSTIAVKKIVVSK